MERCAKKQKILKEPKVKEKMTSKVSRGDIVFVTHKSGNFKCKNGIVLNGPKRGYATYMTYIEVLCGMEKYVCLYYDVGEIGKPRFWLTSNFPTWNALMLSSFVKIKIINNKND